VRGEEDGTQRYVTDRKKGKKSSEEPSSNGGGQAPQFWGKHNGILTETIKGPRRRPSFHKRWKK